MANTNYNKVIYNGKTLIDLTTDTVTADKVLSGYTFHDKSGASSEGTCDYDADTSSDTASAGDILATKTAHVKGSLVTGSMTNNATVNGTISTKAGAYTIPQGYHSGSGKVTIATTEQNKIVAANIKSGVSILGVSGSYTGEAIQTQEKTATPSASAQTITPDSGKYLTKVTVNAIPYSEEDNSAGGITVTIG